MVKCVKNETDKTKKIETDVFRCGLETEAGRTKRNEEKGTLRWDENVKWSKRVDFVDKEECLHSI